MFHQAIRDVLPHGVKDEVNPLPTCHFRRRNKVRVTGNQNDLIYLLLEGKRGYIHTNAHIDTFLLGVDLYIGFREVCNLYLAFEQLLDLFRLDCPRHIAGQMT